MANAPRLLRTSLAIVLIFLILVGMHALGWLRPIESGIAFIVEPVAKGARSVVNRVGNGIRLVGRISELEDENSRLSQELEAAQVRIAQLQEGQAELTALQERFEAPIQEGLTTSTAQVIGHDAISGTKRLVISRGESDGVAVGMPVLSSGGIFVGVVDNVLASQSEVLLIADDRSSVPTRIAESRATGILRGELGLGLKMTDIPQQETLNEGDQVVTSGLGGSIPSGLPIGTVEAVEAAANALFQVAHVRPYVDVTTLEYIQIVTEY